jgi:DnaJ-class molecular chaperone
MAVSADPYTVLGVKKDASQDDIQKAYRRLAKKLHPDLNPGNKKAEEQFKEVTQAYDLLGDADKRAKFDRGEIDESGNERPRQRYYRDYAESGAGHPYSSDSGFADFGDADDILSQIFGRQGAARGAGGEGRGTFRMRGADVHYGLELDFLDAINGATRSVTLPDGKGLDVRIPPGTRDGQILRLRGKGRPGIGGGPPGDALVEITVRPHRYFRLDGDDIRLDLPISLTEAVLGARIKVPTPTGSVTMTVPKWANTGTVLRLKGKGAPRRGGGHGDQYVRLEIFLPEKPDPELAPFIETWPGRDYNPRQGMEA